MQPTNDRIDQFKTDIAGMKLKAGSGDTERVLQLLGVLLMIAGVVGAFLAYQSSLNQDDTRDIQSLLVLGVAMLTLSLVGAAMYLRYSMAKFLRLWLLRQLYESQAQVDRIVSSVQPRS